MFSIKGTGLERPPRDPPSTARISRAGTAHVEPIVVSEKIRRESLSPLLLKSPPTSRASIVKKKHITCVCSFRSFPDRAGLCSDSSVDFFTPNADETFSFEQGVRLLLTSPPDQAHARARKVAAALDREPAIPPSVLVAICQTLDSGCDVGIKAALLVVVQALAEDRDRIEAMAQCGLLDEVKFFGSVW